MRQRDISKHKTFAVVSHPHDASKHVPSVKRMAAVVADSLTSPVPRPAMCKQPLRFSASCRDSATTNLPCCASMKAWVRISSRTCR